MKKLHFKPKRRPSRILPAVWVEDSWSVPVNMVGYGLGYSRKKLALRRQAKTLSSISLPDKASGFRVNAGLSGQRSVEVLIRVAPQPQAPGGQEGTRSNERALEVHCAGEIHPIRFGWPRRH